ncbi:sodium-dependent nutrient amino acid transporter 1-like [Leguminivora glycinivorella]|uniref:sodium-dependent nutrient amino acid transporter 1-like n=1 Tax=Leguminivora glycinivorella TaxID=1035111 RepID=UPI00200F5FF8|nr:sodium-dependent nutrient amino acid transporter 1-like [Leguminivora glycinivorella]
MVAAPQTVTIFHFTAFALLIGMTYLCAELFIRQYTQRLDWDQNLCPVLKGITVSLILQYTLFCLLSETIMYVSLVYGIGMIGVQDFGSISPFTMTDNAVIIFTVLFILLSAVLYSLTVTRLIHSEFPSMKFIYIQGLICIFGFILSVPILLKIRTGLVNGLHITILFLGGLRMAIIMWIYGVKKFSTDIHFWLGFSPTKFWTVCWSILPAMLWIAFSCLMYELAQGECDVVARCTLAWFLISAGMTFAFQTRILVIYAMKNNLMGAFRNNKKYGPFDKRDRMRRRQYDVSIDDRQCFHDCLALDEDTECNHMPLMNMAEGLSSVDSQITLMQMYESAPSRAESVITILEMKPETKEKQA